MLRFVLIFYLFFVVINVQAQMGSSCANPNIITSVPFSQMGLTTTGLFNYYTSAHACGSNWMNGNDYIFTYTPTADEFVKIKLSNTGIYAGVFVISDCPDAPGAICVAKNESDDSGNPVIPGVALTAGTTYYIVVSTQNFFTYNMTTNFNIEISHSFPYDGGTAYVNLPKSTCGFTNNEELNVVLENYGSDTIENFYFAYKINDGLEMENFYGAAIPPGGWVYHTAASNMDLSSVGTTYKIKAYTKIVNDGNRDNDTTYHNITNLPVVSSFPYEEDFESDAGSWVTEWTDSRRHYTSWEHGLPNDTALDHAASGLYCWKTNLDSTTMQSESSVLLGPCFDFTNVEQPWIDMNIWYQLNNLDLVIFEKSTNGGVNWIRIGNSGEGTNWYNVPQGVSTIGWHGSSGEWMNAKHALDGCGGLSSVILRVKIITGNAEQNAGFAVDDIKIYEAPQANIGVSSVISPLSNCGLTNNETVVVGVYNYGLAPQADFDVAYRINDGILISETVTDTVQPGETLNFMFSQSADFSAYINYKIFATTILTNDFDSTNDADSMVIANYPSASTFPYIQDFETSAGGWFSSGINSTWEWGTPADTGITHAASGSNCWVTNLAGLCGSPEQSFLTGPCFNLALLKRPYVKFKVWYENEQGFFGTQFECSADGGLSWPNLGAASDSQWYNQGHNWSGRSKGWDTVLHSLDVYQGVQNIQFRFEFAGYEFSGFGFDDFEICDAPIAFFKYTTSGSQINFIDSSINASQYLWDFGDGTTSTEQNPVHTFTTLSAGDTVQVRLIVTNDCFVDTFYQDVIKSGVGELNFSKVKIYPNPSDKFITIESEDADPIEVVTISDFQGKVVLNFNAGKTSKQQVDVSNISTGVYFLKVRTMKANIARKITIE
ncbi:MAG: hypothetical protein A2309_12855 [Bacteroidetes bacterium RIFOXYB2_FULL_35_7]|nr:MAG: hypothetical protein A2X01_11370 [Bacteroidetes bacterium GWF2_35_48]OFY92853.1 MAG: hypothetical protein A2309_12855 [Bacteroidetes bacterium RIFOXYB2_FULL_35_7]